MSDMTRLVLGSAFLFAAVIAMGFNLGIAFLFLVGAGFFALTDGRETRMRKSRERFPDHQA